MKRKMILSVLLIFLGIVAFGSYSQAKGKTYRISAKTKPCDPEYIYGGAYNKNTKHYFLIRSYLEKLQKTGGTLLLKKGTYHICSTLYVPSNVTIRLAAKTKIKKTIKSGTTRRKPTKYLFLLTRESKAKKSDTAKYKSSRNVSFIGGSGSVIDMGFTKEAIGIGMAHNYNVSIKKIQFKNRYGGNYIAAAGAKKVSIDQCKFYAGKDLLNEESKYDIRLEVANKEIDTLGFSWSKLDNTTNDNILIQNNLFSGMYGAIGTTKHAHPVVGKKKKPKIFYQKNIRIKNNKFLNITGTAVKGMAWNGFTASGNSFYLNKSGKVNTPYGIHLYGAKQPVIQKNVFNKINMPVRFSLSVNKGKGKKQRNVKNELSNDKIETIAKNTVKNAAHYYVLFSNNGKDKRIAYYFDVSDKRLVITSATKPYREMYMDKSTYGTNTKDYFVFQSHMEQLERSGGGTLTVKAGTYNISNAVHVPSNVTVTLENGVVINKISAKYGKTLTVPKAIFIFVAASLEKKTGAVSAYNGSHDIKFIGKGNVTIDCKFSRPGQAIIMGHNKNVKISGINFRRQQGAHFIELNSSYNAVVENCTFQYFHPNVVNGEEEGLHKEAINIDGTDKLINGFNYVWSARDQTTCKYITIRNCTFSDVGAGIGSHTYFTKGSTRLYHENIKIYNNTFKNTLHSAVRVLNWRNFEITKNTFDSIGYNEDLKKYGYTLYGIHLRGAVNPLIKNNTFRNCKWAISTQKVTTSKRYPETISSISKEKWMAMLDNTLINCPEAANKMRFWNADEGRADTGTGKGDFTDAELPEGYRDMTYHNIQQSRTE